MNSPNGSRLPFPCTFRTEPITYLLLGGIVGALTVPIIIGGYVRNEPSAEATGILILAMLFVWLASYRIVLAEDSITYQSLFSGRTTILYADIVSCQIMWSDPSKISQSAKPPFWLEIVPADMSRTKSLKIHIKLFARQDLISTLSVLVAKATGAKFNQASLGMAAGKMPSSVSRPRPRRKKEGPVAKTIGFLVFMGVTFVFCKGLYFGVTNSYFGYQSKYWQQTTGQVLDRNYDHNSHGYSVYVKYHYSFVGTVHTGNRLSYPEMGYSKSDAENKVAKYRPGSSVTVYFDPVHPENSCLEPGLSYFILLTMVPLFLLLSLGCGCGWYFYFRRLFHS